MKEKTLYICEYCHTGYADETAAIACEQNHAVNLRIVEKKYVSKGIDGSGFPQKITIQDKDGRKVFYEKRGQA